MKRLTYSRIQQRLDKLSGFIPLTFVDKVSWHHPQCRHAVQKERKCSSAFLKLTPPVGLKQPGKPSGFGMPVPPDASAGKNFNVRSPISIACSTRLGLFLLALLQYPYRYSITAITRLKPGLTMKSTPASMMHQLVL